MPAKRTSIADTEIGKRVFAHRHRLGLSQSEIAKRLGLTFQQVQKYEKGINRIPAGRLLQLADIFGIPVSALFPHANTNGDQQNSGQDDALAEILLTTDGRRLSQAFLRIEDRFVRKSIIALVETLADEPKDKQPRAP